MAQPAASTTAAVEQYDEPLPDTARYEDFDAGDRHPNGHCGNKNCPRC